MMGSTKTKVSLVVLVIVAASVIWTMKVRRADAAHDTSQSSERESRAAEYKPFKADCERGRATEQQFSNSIQSRNGKYQHTERAALEKRLVEVRPGMGEEEVIRTVGKPSYVEAFWRNDTDLVCAWKYVLSGHWQSGEFIVDESAEIAFDKLHRAMTAAEMWQKINPGSVR